MGNDFCHTYYIIGSRESSVGKSVFESDRITGHWAVALVIFQLVKVIWKITTRRCNSLILNFLAGVADYTCISWCNKQNIYTTAEPIYNGYPQALINWPLNTRWPLYRITKNTHWAWCDVNFNGVSTKTLHEGNNRTIHALSSYQYFKQRSVPTCNLTV